MTNPALNQTVMQELQQYLPNNSQAYNDLINAINQSPTLVDQLNNDISLVGQFQWVNQVGFGAQFVQGNGATLSQLDIGSNQVMSEFGRGDIYDIDQTLGHELGHAEFDQSNPTGVTATQAENNFLQEINQNINSGSSDFTSAVQQQQENMNYNEAYAQIRGFNAELSAYYSNNGIVNPTQSQIDNAYNFLSQKSTYAQYFLANGSLMPGFTASGDGSLSESLPNMGAEGDYYYLNSNSLNVTGGLSIFGDKDYTNNYGTGQLGSVVDGYLGNSSNYTSDGPGGSDITLSKAIQINFAEASPSNSSSLVSDGSHESFDGNQLAQDLARTLNLPSSATSVSFTVEDTSTGTSYVYAVGSNGVTTVEDGVGATPLVYVGDSALGAANPYQVTTSNSVVTVAAGYGSVIDGSGNSDILGNGSTLVTQSGDTNNTITCGSSVATVNGASAESCLVTSAGNFQLTVDGSGLTGSLQGNVVLTESGDTFSASSNANINMASGDTVNVGSGTSGVQLTCGSSTETISVGASGSESRQCTITDGVGTFSNNGNNLTINQAGTGQSMTLTGTNNSVVSSGNSLTLDGAGSNASVVGINTVNLNGTGQSLVLATNGSTVNTNAGDTSETLNGSGLILNGGSGLFSGMVTGSNNTFNLDTNSNSILDINGTGNVANSSQNIVRLWGSDTSATISGVNLIGLDGSNQLLTLDNTGDAVDAAANISGETITGSGVTFTGSNAFNGWFTGSNNTFNLASDSGSALHVNGTNNLVDSTQNTVLLAGANTSATITGANLIGLDDSNQSLTLNNTGDALDAAANISGETITGSGLTFTGSNAFSGWFTGSNNTFNLASDSSSALHVSGTNNLVNSTENTILLASAGTSATIAGVDTIGLDASNQLLTLNSSGDGLDAAANISGETVIGSGLSFTGSNAFSGWFTGSNNTFNLASDSGSALHVSGADNLVNSFQNIVLLASVNTSATISGVNTIGLDDSNQSLTLNSSGDGLDAAANISGETVIGSGLSFTGSNAFSGWFTGSNNTFNLASDSGSALHVSGTNNLVDSVQNTILLASAYTSATVSGANTIGLDASNQSLTLQSSGSGVDAAANISGESITGSSLTCTGASNDNIAINGDNAVINGGASDYFNLTGSNDTFNAGANDSLKWNSSNGQYTENAAYNASAGLSNEQLYTDTSGASTEVVSLANNASNGQSTVQWYDGYDLPSGYTGWTETFGGQDASGELLQETQTNSSNYTADIDYFYNSQGQLVDYSDTWYSSSGVDDGTAYYDPYGDLMSGYDSYDMTADAGSSEDDGFYGLTGTTQSINNALNSVGGGLTQSLLNTGTASDLATADIGLQRAALSAANGASQSGSAAASPYEDAHWYPASKGKQEIEVTWSAAGAGGKFSGQLNTSELAAVEQAFDTWGNASGIDFEEVSDPSKADIRVGLGDLNTATSGVAGYTDCQSVAGMMQGADIYLEDPNQDALVSQTSGDATYAGTSATFEQTALHEIGHALGLASNTDANSIMYYALTAGNRALDASDVSNIQNLYGYVAQGTAAPAEISAMAMQSATQVHQLVQAMGSFDAGEQGIDSNPLAQVYPQSEHMLGSSLSHAHTM